jgi:hypothetical protein
MKYTSKDLTLYLRRNLRETLRPRGFRQRGRLLLREERAGVSSIVELDVLRGTEASRLEFRVMFHSYHVEHEQRVTGRSPDQVPNLIYPALSFEMSQLRGEKATLPYYCENLPQADDLCKEFDDLIDSVALPILEQAADYANIDALRHKHPVIGRPPRDPEKDALERAKIEKMIAGMNLKLPD